MVAVTVAAVAGSALLLGVYSSLQTADHALEATVAMGMAQQLMDEVAGARYCDYKESDGVLTDVPYNTVLKPSVLDAAPGTRERFTDSDDFNGFQSQPPTDRWGAILGTDDVDGNSRHPNFQAPTIYYNNWRQEIHVYYVDDEDLSQRLPAGQVSDHRAIEVRIVAVNSDGGERELASLRRVIAYVKQFVPD